MKKAALYNRWFHTLGGGEQAAFCIAEVLQDLGYEVTLLSHTEIDFKTLKSKLNVDLTGAKVKLLPILTDKELADYTEDYDVFINSSYLDYIPNRAKVGILNIFFPSKTVTSLLEMFKRAVIVPFLKQLFIFPTVIDDSNFVSVREGVFLRKIEKQLSVIFNHTVTQTKLVFHFSELATSDLEKISFTLDGKKINPASRSILHHTNDVSYRFDFSEDTIHKRLTVHKEKTVASSISLKKVRIPNVRFWLYLLFKKLFPKWEIRLHGGPTLTNLSDIKSYQKILCNSSFSQTWIKKYWGLESDVIYAPVSIKDFSPSPQKTKSIIHIGRFFVGGHSKKQLEIVRAFKQLYDQDPSWELNLVGRVYGEKIHFEYLGKVQKEAEGYPVNFHIDAKFSELKKLLTKSRFYWHATGFEEDETEFPIRMEHFGITTVEAMASGCVPIVINKGGQPEIVTEEAGLKWNTLDELVNQTLKVISDPKLETRLRAGAIKRSKQFSKKEFKKRVKASILEAVNAKK